MNNDLEIKKEEITPTLPTGKSHVSFSELSCWNECSMKHHIKYIKHIDSYVQNSYATFGTVIHSMCENYLKTRSMDHRIDNENELRRLWIEHSFTDIENWINSLNRLAIAFPSFFEETFPGWELIAAEEQLFESIKDSDVSFKGYIDSVIKIKKNEKDIFWIIDYKTCSWGWAVQKKRSFDVQLQLMLYKSFWAKKHNVDLNDVRCAFALMKRNAGQVKQIELVQISVGDKTLEKALKALTRMIIGVKRRLVVLNRDACNRCEFFMTEHCTSA